LFLFLPFSLFPLLRYEPHITLGKFKNESELEKAQSKILLEWEDSEFYIHELYFLSRVRGDPFEIIEVLPIGKTSLRTLMGPDSVISSSSRFCYFKSSEKRKRKEEGDFNVASI